MRPDWRAVGLALGLLAVALVPRLAGRGGFVTADELRWTCRAVGFRAALEGGDWAGTWQSGHPGVTATWLAGIGSGFAPRPELLAACAKSPSAIAETEPWAVRAALRDLLYDARARLAVAHAVLLAVTFWLAARLVGQGAAVVGCALLALEPFVVGLSRVLHLDALAGELMLLSALALVAYARAAGGRRWLVASGGLAGLAFLTKAPALYLGLCAAVAVWLAPRRGVGRPARGARRAADLALWAGVALGVVTALWPSMWVDPVGTAGKVLGTALGYAAEAQKTTSFFLGARVEEPGWRFYPLALAMRATPLLLAGLALALPAARGSERRRALWALALYAAGFALLLGLSEKKYDRYLAPALMAAALVAGAGWDHALGRLVRPGRRWARPVATGLLLVAVALPVARAHPYELAWYSPLVGGTAGAGRLTLLGWGEGLEQVADWLNARPSAEASSAVGWGATLGPLYRGRVLRDKAENRARADYIVVYVSDVQTGKDGARLLLAPGPAFVARVLGVGYAWVVANPERAEEGAEEGGASR